jgi:hypothetical protein
LISFYATHAIHLQPLALSLAQFTLTHAHVLRRITNEGNTHINARQHSQYESHD